DGILGAIAEAEDAAFSAGLLVSVHRHRSEEAAFEVLRAVEPWSDRILGIGMGGAEIGNPPMKFARFFRAAQDAGFPTMVHAGEEGPAAYVRDALDLDVQRIDHGVAAAADPALVADLAARGVPLTVDPQSDRAALDREPAGLRAGDGPVARGDRAVAAEWLRCGVRARAAARGPACAAGGVPGRLSAASGRPSIRAPGSMAPAR
ncbi:MAG: hypothetical protein J0H99_21975, partial [Rhodospirillales bacterium]|nr:hypothetical protein [Rhodospirillales bacterium]